MNESTNTSPRLVSINCRQLVLHSVDVDRLIGEDHRARLIWELVGGLDLGPQSCLDCVGRRERRSRGYRPAIVGQPEAVRLLPGGSVRRARYRAREYEPGLQWLCGLAPISHRTLSGFRSECKGALDDLFVQVLGMMSAEGLITLERVTLDGTKIKANAGANSFRRKQNWKRTWNWRRSKCVC
jgi:transposase